MRGEATQNETSAAAKPNQATRRADGPKRRFSTSVTRNATG